MQDTKKKEKQGLYKPQVIEKRWQAYWETNRTFRSLNPGEPGADTSKPKFYVLDMFPYPSGSGLHVGHPLGYCATDIIARYKRMNGFNVLHPMGFDSFGLPAEQYAIETNVHPAVTTRKNIETYRKQLKMFGFSYDWDRELATSDPTFYRFTQWMFTLMFESWYDEHHSWTDAQGQETLGRARPITELIDEWERGNWGVDSSLQLIRESDEPGRREWSDLTEQEKRQALDQRRLAFLAEIAVNWCPALGTVLSNEEVDNEGRSDRGSHPVFRRPLRQWMLRITAYSDRLLKDLDELDWPEPIKTMQRNWVGKSTGADVVFPLADCWSIEAGKWKHRDPNACGDQILSVDRFPDSIKVYTTRPDTLFGATYMVLAPEHELVEKITTAEKKSEVAQYVQRARNRSDLERTSDTKEKTGVFTGAYAINPVNGEKIPIWVADYVLIGYGTGAIMAVPAGDHRDFEFACTFDLPIVTVVEPPTSWIEEQLKSATDLMDERAADGFVEVASEYPELGEAIEASRARSAGLGEKTRRLLLEKLGPERLVSHFVDHPRSWGAAFTESGKAVHSPSSECDVPGGVCRLNGMGMDEAKATIIAWLEANGVGRGAVNYKLRDWIFSRQKYWGEPFPVLHDESGHTIAETQLPVELPELENFQPVSRAPDDADSEPEPPLGRAKEWLVVEKNGINYRRDVNTMPQWAGSCWYYLRFIDPHNPDVFANSEAEKYWMPIDLYVGGAEHAVLHLLYARFWHKVLFDLGFVSTREPFNRLFNQGMIQGFAFKDDRGLTLGPDSVEETDREQFVAKESGKPVSRVIAKMSKSLKNVVNPDEIIAKYGADTFRLYEMYMGPLDAAKPWNTRDVPGLYKLCQRIWRLYIDEETGDLSTAVVEDVPDEASLRILHKTIRRVSDDIEQIKLNTAIAALFDFVNAMTPMERRSRQVLEPFLLLLSPFAPHLAEELWSRLGHEDSLAYEPWPVYDEKLARDETIEIAVQVTGKIKARINIASDATEKAMEEAALADERVIKAIKGKTVRKVIIVKGRLVNVVAT